MSNATAPDLTGQVAVITGAGRGIGRALGTRLAAEGMKVFPDGTIEGLS